MSSLHPCPACGSESEKDEDYVTCTNTECKMLGPSGDLYGTKWNTMCSKLGAGKPDLATKYHEHRMRIAEDATRLGNDVETAVAFADELLAALGWEKP